MYRLRRYIDDKSGRSWYSTFRLTAYNCRRDFLAVRRCPVKCCPMKHRSIKRLPMKHPPITRLHMKNVCLKSNPDRDRAEKEALRMASLQKKTFVKIGGCILFKLAAAPYLYRLIKKYVKILISASRYGWNQYDQHRRLRSGSRLCLLRWRRGCCLRSGHPCIRGCCS